jgi:hypothetical protein
MQLFLGRLNVRQFSIFYNAWWELKVMAIVDKKTSCNIISCKSISAIHTHTHRQTHTHTHGANMSHPILSYPIPIHSTLPAHDTGTGDLAVTTTRTFCMVRPVSVRKKKKREMNYSEKQ